MFFGLNAIAGESDQSLAVYVTFMYLGPLLCLMILPFFPKYSVFSPLGIVLVIFTVLVFSGILIAIELPMWPTVLASILPAFVFYFWGVLEAEAFLNGTY